MLTMVRYQLFRMAKARLTWGLTAAFALFVVAGVIVTGYFGSNAAMEEAMRATSSDAARGIDAARSASSLAVWSTTFVNGSLLAMTAAAFCACFVAADFKGGFAKNILQARGGRASYAGATIVVAAAASVLFMLAGIAACEAGYRIVGYSLVLPDLGRALAWFAQVVLCSMAYALIAALVAAAFSSDTAGVLAGVLLGGYAVEKLIRFAVYTAFSTPADADPLSASPSAALMELSRGALAQPSALIVTLAVAFVAAWCLLAVVKRKAL